MATIPDKLRRLEKLAAADAARDPKAHGELLKGIDDLLLAAETPIETTSRLNFQPLQNICIRVAIEKGWLHIIASNDGGSVTAKQLSQKTAVDEIFVARVMRVLTAIGLCDEVGIQTYAPNARTHFKILPGSIGAEKHHFDLDFAMGGRLKNYMRGPGIHQFGDNPGEVTLFQYAHGTKTIFGFMEKDSEQKECFDDYMRSRREAEAPQWFDIYPAATEFSDARRDPDAILLVDIGGGPGQELERFREKNPHVPGRCVLQDLPVTLRRIDKMADGIEAMEYDFFTPQPLKGARAYFLRDVLHNWSDVYSKKILSRVVEAMDPEYSTLLVDDYVLGNVDVSLREAEMDVLMWLHTSGIERTLRHWTALFGSVGLEIIKIWSIEGAITPDLAVSGLLPNPIHSTNFTDRLASIPPDFNIELQIQQKSPVPPEACFTNIVAALLDVALGDFRANMEVATYRTTRFPTPIIKLGAPKHQEYVARRYIVWGLYLSALYLHLHNAFHLVFFSLQYKGVEVAGICIGAPALAGERNETAALTPAENVNIVLDFAYFGGTLELGRDSVFMIMIASLMEAAPSAESDLIYETIINYLHDEPAAFIATPTRAARSGKGQVFTNRMLLEALARSAEFYNSHGKWRQVEVNITAGGVMVAQAAFVQRSNLAAWSANVAEA
ncbi:MAG: hypothetical protein Q9220_007558 [cf. Caloplaca sp. 1 TL-2023]